jgi:fucokinase
MHAVLKQWRVVCAYCIRVLQISHSHSTITYASPLALAISSCVPYYNYMLDRSKQQADGSYEPQKQVQMLVVSDPAGARVGSGGGTLNALAQLSQLNEGSWCLADHCTLMIHSGGDSQRSPTQSICGKAWSSLNSVSSSAASRTAQRANTPLDLLLQHFYTLFAQLEQGSLVIACCDVMLLLGAIECNWKPLNSNATGGVAGLAIAADVSYAPQHGVYVLAPNIDSNNHHTEGSSSSSSSSSESVFLSSVTQYLQKPSAQQAAAAGAVSSTGTVAVDTGVVVFSSAAATALQQLACSPTFAGCCSSSTHAEALQPAAAAQPLRLELYADIMLALRTGAATGSSNSSSSSSGSFDAYLTACGARSSDDVALTCARRELHSALSGFSLDALLLNRNVATFAHLGSTAELMQMLTLQMPAFIEPYGLTHR